MSTHAYPVTGARVPAPVWRLWSLLVTALVVASAGLLVARFAFDGDTFQNCRYLGPSTRMYVTSWAAPACGLASVVLLLGLRRGARLRGQRPGAVWQGRVALAAVCLVPLLLLAQFAALYWVYEPDPSGGQDCSGLTLTHDRAGWHE